MIMVVAFGVHDDTSEGDNSEAINDIVVKEPEVFSPGTHMVVLIHRNFHAAGSHEFTAVASASLILEKCLKIVL